MSLSLKMSFITICVSLFSLNLYAQDIDQISVGAGYTLQSYYDIESGEVTSIDNSSWDISFSTIGFQDASISINESASLMGNELELYDLGNMDFDTEIIESDLNNRVFNSESNWSDGAFNFGRDESNFADFGWGMYNPSTMEVIGTKLFALKLRDDKLIKIKIESLSQTQYILKYANLDGTNLNSVVVDKANFWGKQRAYFSFESASVLDLEPDNWDLLFTRYTSPVDDGEGNILNYMVTGVLSAAGVEIAQADDIDPINVNASDFENNFSNDSDVIGFDWKEINISTFQWNVILDRVYFVKTLEGNLFKLYFFDFEGSSTGISTIEKLELESSANENLFVDKKIQVVPNPNNGSFTILNKSSLLDIKNAVIYDYAGRVVLKLNKEQINGNNQLNIKDSLSPGLYFLKIELDNEIQTLRIIIN